MIFVTVGAQMPFDRMVRTVDEWAAKGTQDVVAQIGPTDHKPKHIRWTQFLEPAAFRRQVEAATVVVAHAGMGSILTALELSKPILVMPRRGDLRETRNDHQIATAKHFLSQGRISVAFDENELSRKLSELSCVRAADPIPTHASPRLIGTLRSFVDRDDSSSRQSGWLGCLPFSGVPMARRRTERAYGPSSDVDLIPEPS